MKLTAQKKPEMADVIDQLVYGHSNALELLQRPQGVGVIQVVALSIDQRFCSGPPVIVLDLSGLDSLTVTGRSVPSFCF